MAMDGSNAAAAEELAVSCFVSIKTTLGDDFQGQVITFDRPSNILILQEGLKGGPKQNIRLLKANYIKELSYLVKLKTHLTLRTVTLILIVSEPEKNQLSDKQRQSVRGSELVSPARLRRFSMPCLRRECFALSS